MHPFYTELNFIQSNTFPNYQNVNQQLPTNFELQPIIQTPYGPLSWVEMNNRTYSACNTFKTNIDNECSETVKNHYLDMYTAQNQVILNPNMNTMFASMPTDSFPPQLLNIASGLDSIIGLEHECCILIILQAITIASCGSVIADVNLENSWIEPLCSYVVVSRCSAGRKTSCISILKDPFQIILFFL